MACVHVWCHRQIIPRTWDNDEEVKTEFDFLEKKMCEIVGEDYEMEEWDSKPFHRGMERAWDQVMQQVGDGDRAMVILRYPVNS